MKTSIEIRLEDIEEEINSINLKIFTEPIVKKYVSSIKNSISKIRESEYDPGKVLDNTNSILESTEYIRNYCIENSRSVVDDCNLLIKAYAWQIIEELENY